MPSLRDFMERLDAAKPHGVEQLETAEDLAANAEIMREHAAVFAERAHVDADELGAIAHERASDMLAVAVRIAQSGTASAQVVIQSAMADCFAWGFLFGALWEQERHLPDLGGVG